MVSEVALRELKEIEAKQNEDYADSLRDAAAYLLQRQWVWREKRGQKQYFRLCEENQTYFNKLFDALKMNWYFNRNFGYAGVLPRGTGKQMDIISSLFLLILRQMYDAEASMGRTDIGRVNPPTDELLNLYEQVKGEMPLITETNAALESLKRKGVIELGNRDAETKLYEITVLPNIIRVVTTGYLEMLDRFIDSYSDDSDSKAQPFEDLDKAITDQQDESYAE